MGTGRTVEDGRAARTPRTFCVHEASLITHLSAVTPSTSRLVRYRHSGRRARVGGNTKVGADFGVPAAAVNLARPATLGVTHHAVAGRRAPPDRGEHRVNAPRQASHPPLSGDHGPTHQTAPPNTPRTAPATTTRPPYPEARDATPGPQNTDLYQPRDMEGTSRDSPPSRLSASVAGGYSQLGELSAFCERSRDTAGRK
jgi:hypothetical protein